MMILMRPFSITLRVVAGCEKLAIVLMPVGSSLYFYSLTKVRKRYETAKKQGKMVCKEKNVFECHKDSALFYSTKNYSFFVEKTA
jgi:hypothetical protein